MNMKLKTNETEAKPAVGQDFKSNFFFSAVTKLQKATLRKLVGWLQAEMKLEFKFFMEYIKDFFSIKYVQRLSCRQMLLNFRKVVSLSSLLWSPE